MAEKKKGTYQHMVVCPRNDAVHCYKPGDCYRCGWNQDVAKARTEKFNSQFKKEEKT